MPNHFYLKIINNWMSLKKAKLHLIWFILREKYNYTYRKIVDKYGIRFESTISQAIKTINIHSEKLEFANRLLKNNSA
jgi:hypothetical protein